jgi:hypothetical protein
MNARFDLATIERCSEIPACRGREVLSLLIEVDPISGKESEQYPDAYPKEYRQSIGLRKIVSFWKNSQAFSATADKWEDAPLSNPERTLAKEANQLAGPWVTHF